MKVGIIDYGAGNLRSVHKAVESLGVGAQLVREAGQLAEIEALVLPGQGSFGDCLRHLVEQGLREPIRDWILADRPYFGICLGYQILFGGSEESPGVPGLGVFPGDVVRFPVSDLKVPHMGWNEITPVHREDPLWDGLGAHPHVYFVHSYYPRPALETDIACRTSYGFEFASGVRRGNVVATQFHPEKSQDVGLRLLRNFFTSVIPSGARA
ncbi:MAG: imidazole glycerol phosphate synthase subunit HisH [Verrucomicrobia bacterium]|nr:imidazole glycerol phosphate synthase subunit HisH [Verrucomicrobiota bacterium]